MSDIETLKSEIESLKAKVEALEKTAEYASYWAGMYRRKMLAEASERHRQTIIEEHNAYVDSLPHTEG